MTRQLLTFAKSKAAKREVLDLNEVVDSAAQLLRRSLGAQVELVIAPGTGLWPVEADRGQLEQVLVNLAVNARDAMADGGRLTLMTANAEVDAAYFRKVLSYLEAGRALAVQEAGTITWYAFKISDTTYGIFDSFETEDARQAHLGGEIPTALGQVAADLLAKDPDIRPVDVIAVK